MDQQEGSNRCGQTGPDLRVPILVSIMKAKITVYTARCAIAIRRRCFGTIAPRFRWP